MCTPRQSREEEGGLPRPRRRVGGSRVLAGPGGGAPVSPPEGGGALASSPGWGSPTSSLAVEGAVECDCPSLNLILASRTQNDHSHFGI